jgi:hypothetical protein
MNRSPRRRAGLAAVVAFGCVLAASCSSDPGDAPDRPAPTAYTAKGVSCDQDETSLDAKNIIEEVGGLVSDDYVVKFSESTRLGVVALVDGDTDKAYDELTGTYHVAAVAKITSDGSGKVTGFQQIRDLVASICD